MVTPRWVKICGLTNLEDARAAVEAGADAVGFVLVSTSPRALSRREIEQVLMALPRTVLTVGVVGDEDPDFLRDLLRVCPFGAIQFHGEEPPEEVLKLKGEAKLIKAVRVHDARSLEIIPRYQGVDAVLLESYDPQRKGGTGTTFDWTLAAQARGFGIPVIVAGGLTPANVQEVVRQADPYGVDVSSGVESAPGRKDPALIREFVLKAKQR